MSQARALYYLRMMRSDNSTEQGRKYYMGAFQLYALTYALDSDKLRIQLEQMPPWTDDEKVPLPE